ncbi:MAG: transketolase [Oscillospiraceae bacterium]|nr:transketolase [Oscillospiraceae bacterium]
MTNTKELNELKNKATEIRIRAVDMIYKAQSGHPGGALSVADFTAACYFHEMKLDPKNPQWPLRDRFVLSKGHACPAQYAALAMKGFFDLSHLDTLRKEGSILQGHPDMKKCPGIDISTGSLGQGFACGVGMALAAKMDALDYRVYVALGDGECQEGEIWEAAQTANKYKLDNLVVFVDNNNLQIDGTCDEVMPNIDLGKKFAAFGFDCYEIDGNDMAQVVAALELAKVVKNGRPKCLFANTVKGKGVSYMENQCGWHGTAPNEEEYKQAIAELESQYIVED